MYGFREGTRVLLVRLFVECGGIRVAHLGKLFRGPVDFVGIGAIAFFGVTGIRCLVERTSLA